MENTETGKNEGKKEQKSTSCSKSGGDDYDFDWSVPDNGNN